MTKGPARPARPASGGGIDPLLWGRRAAGLALLVLILLPLHRVLDDPGTGFPGAQAVAAGDSYYLGMWRDTALVLLLATIPAFLLRGGRLEAALGRVGRLLARPSRGAFAAGLASVAFLGTAAFALLVLDGKPVLTDAVAQLVQGRYVAAGTLAGPGLEEPEFWAFQFMLDTPGGWVSQYPPLHSLFLGAGFRAGAVWLTGPVLMAATAALAVPVAERLLPDDPPVARLGAALAGLSPLLVGLAGSYMNHAPAAALGLAAAWCALRARDGRRWWAVAAGAAAGAMVAARPLSGLVVGAVATLGVWLASREARPDGDGAWGAAASDDGAGGISGAGFLARAGLAALGAVPFGVGLAAYNLRFFGHPFRFGYIAGSGPRHGLGFHVDPWGNPYGPPEALGYTSADLLALGRDLLGTPVSAVAVVAVFLLLARRLRPGVRVLLAWALLPVAAHAFYWHHDLVLGPRLLGEAAPAWAMLAAVAAAALVRRVPPDERPRGAFSPRTALASALVLALGAGLLWFGPNRLARLDNRVVADPVWVTEAQLREGDAREGEEPEGGAPEGGPARAPGPASRAAVSSAPALVFVHEGWHDRLAARLVGRGFRLDSIRTLLTRHRPCRIQAGLDGLSGEAAEPECRRQAAADRLGGLSLPSFIWWGDLPGLSGSGTLWVRDLGPERNERLLARFPEREPWLLLPPAAGRRASRAVPYQSGVRVLWGGDRAGEPEPTAVPPPAGAPPGGPAGGASTPYPGRDRSPAGRTPPPIPTPPGTPAPAGW